MSDKGIESHKREFRRRVPFLGRNRSKEGGVHPHNEENSNMHSKEGLSEHIHQHRGLVASRRHAFYSKFTKDVQELLEKEFRKWPITHEGAPLPGMRARFMKVLRLDHRQPGSQDLCDMWMELVGWSIIGRDTWIDSRGVIWGPSPFDDVDHKYPYSRAVYDKVEDMWLMKDDTDELYDLFYGGYEGDKKQATGG